MFASRIACFALVVLSTGLASAQTISTWSGSAGVGNWSNAANWDVLPVSGADAKILLSGTSQPVTIQNIAAPFQLTTLTLKSGATDFTVSGSPLRFVSGGTNPATIVTNSTMGRLLAAPNALWRAASLTLAASTAVGNSLTARFAPIPEPAFLSVFAIALRIRRRGAP